MSGRRNVITASLCALALAAVGAGTVALAESPGTKSGSAAPASPRQAGPLLSDEEASSITVDADVTYREVDGEPLKLDVCRAADAEGTQAAVLVIHGGGFRAGDKDSGHWQRICRWVANAGFVVVDVNYRLAPEHPYPAAVNDVQAAVVWTREHAEDYGIDPDRIGVLGGSAGGNLAQLLGTIGEGSTSAGSRVASVVSLSGPSDLTEAALALGHPDERQIQLVLDYLGCTEITDCPAAEEASPVSHVDATDPPFLILHSENERMPVEQAQALADALTAAGTEPDLLIRPGHAHSVRLLADPTVRRAVLDFLEQTLG